MRRNVWKWLGTLVCLALLVQAAWLDRHYRGIPGVRADVPKAVGEKGEALPDFTLPDIDGKPVSLSDFRGRRVLLTFERSVDW